MLSEIRHFLFALLALTTSSIAWADCKPGDPAGNFAGPVLSEQAGKLEVSFNLRCMNGRYEGELITPVGNFSVTSASAEGNKLRLQLTPVTQGLDPVTIEAKVEDNQFTGSFVSGEDKGTLDLRRAAAVKAIAPPPDPKSTLTAQQWREDLAFLAREVAKRHANAFHATSREKFEAAVAALDARIDGLNRDQIYIGMDQIANQIGDGHTYVEFPADDANLAIDIRQFGQDYRVVAVAPGIEKALGARVVRIDNTPIARARELARTITPLDETQELADGRIEGFLTTGMALHGLGITADREVAHYGLAGDDGNEFVAEVHAQPRGPRADWMYAAKQVPLFRQNPDQKNWCKYLGDARTVYCRLRQIRGLGAPGKEMRALVEREKPDKLVIDLRQNGGGDYNEGLRNFIHPIRDMAELNRKGHLFVLIGANTFSAAMSNSAQFREQTHALLVGQTIGEKPNSYQEARRMTLPNSHWEVQYSVRFYKFIQDGENILRPDKEIIPSWEEFQAGRDPVLEWVLAYKAE
jgi:hypothetical protein